MKKVLKKLLPKRIKLFLLEHRYMFKIKKMNYKNDLYELYKENQDKSLKIDNLKKWIKKLTKLTYSDLSFIEFGKEFMKSKINILKKIDISSKDIILICVEKNDIIKLKKFISHHRSLGIDKFIIVDNDSTDGTVEYLLKQEDVFLLQTKDLYTSIRREVWINRVIAYLGDNRWYIVLDSDELLVYNDYENKNIKDVIKYLEKHNIKRARSFMLEMYAKDDYYLNGNIKDFFDECIYFDKDTYLLKSNEKFINITGGPRKRLFDITTCLTKYPLFYFRKKDILCGSHYLYPYKDNISKKCYLIVKHYKFLPGEINKYKRIAEEENYYNKSSAYKQIINVMNHKKNISFMYENSQKYENSTSLDNISMYNKIDWNV